jgi:uncharacterized membrane protein YebE (DUF533 family)
MKNLLKNKKVLVGLVVVVGALGYYLYDQKKKKDIKAMAEKLADTPATTPSVSDSKKNDIKPLESHQQPKKEE